MPKLNLITFEEPKSDDSDPLSPKKSIGVQTTGDHQEGADNNEKEPELPVRKIKLEGALKPFFKAVRLWVNQQENKGLKLMLIILVGCVIAMFWYLQVQVREFQNMNGGSKSGGSSDSRSGMTGYIAEELPDGYVKVGKIMFRPDELLGTGCEGTFVYR